MKISRKKFPKMIESNAVNAKLRDEESDLQESAAPSAYHDGGSIKRVESNIADPRPNINNVVSKKRAEEDDAEVPAAKPDDKRLPEERYMSSQNQMLAEGGSIDEERDLEHAASMVASIMAKRRMARGGEILSEDAYESDDSSQADLSQNAVESQNQEDQMSFDALMKENYSESEGLDELDYDTDKSVGREIDSDDHDMVSSIRKKIKKSPISK